MYGNKTQTQLTLVKYVEFHVQKQKKTGMMKNIMKEA